jgi:hypothetical protein
MARFIFGHPHPPIEAGEIEEFEHEIRHALPLDYRSFLAETNGGGHPEPSVLRIYGEPGMAPANESVIQAFHGFRAEHYELWNALKVHRRFLPADVIPIGEDPGRNAICLRLGGERRSEVLFWDHERATKADYLYFLASSFTSFVELLRPE